MNGTVHTLARAENAPIISAKGAKIMPTYIHRLENWPEFPGIWTP